MHSSRDCAGSSNSYPYISNASIGKAFLRRQSGARGIALSRTIDWRHATTTSHSPLLAALLRGPGADGSGGRRPRPPNTKKAPPLHRAVQPTEAATAAAIRAIIEVRVPLRDALRPSQLLWGVFPVAAAQALGLEVQQRHEGVALALELPVDKRELRQHPLEGAVGRPPRPNLEQRQRQQNQRRPPPKCIIGNTT